MHEDIKSVLITEEQIKKRVQEMGEQLSKEYAGKRVILICLLKGAAFFACDTGTDGIHGGFFLWRRHYNFRQRGCASGRKGRYCGHACPAG